MSKRGHEKDFFWNLELHVLNMISLAYPHRKELCNLKKVEQFAPRKTLIKEKKTLIKERIWKRENSSR